MKPDNSQIVSGQRIDCTRQGHPVTVCFCKNHFSWENCPSNCPHFPQEQYVSPPKSGLELTRIDNGQTTLFSEDLFLPNIFDFYKMHVESFRLISESHAVCTISFVFSVHPLKESQPQHLADAYMADGWKPHRTDSLLPFLQLYIPKGGIILESRLCIAGLDQSLVFADNHRTTHLPFCKASYRALTDLEKRRFLNGEPIHSALFVDGQRYMGNNVTFYADLVEHRKYSVKIKFFSDTASFSGGYIPVVTDSFSFFFPFKQVFFESSVSLTTFSNMSTVSLSRLKPISTSLPKLFCQQLDPQINDAIWVKEEEKIPNLPTVFSNYCALMVTLLHNVSNYALISDCVSNMHELFLCLFGAINDEDMPFFSPVLCKAGNCSNKPIKVAYRCFIEGLSSVFQEEVVIEPRKFVLISPKLDLLPEKVFRVTGVCQRRITFVLIHENKEVLQRSLPVDVFPRALFPREMFNRQKTQKYSMENYLARFVTPHSAAVAAVISNAAHEKGIPMAISSYNQSQNGEVLKAIYDYLSKDIIYVNRTEASLGHVMPVQRISFPDETIRLRSGNCVDLSLLLCSCYEALGFDTGIVLVPNHAFVQVLVGEQTVYLEPTCLGTGEFFEAVERGRENDKQYTEKRVVDITACRKRGIYPFE